MEVNIDVDILPVGDDGVSLYLSTGEDCGNETSLIDLIREGFPRLEQRLHVDDLAEYKLSYTNLIEQLKTLVEDLDKIETYGSIK